MQSKQEKSLEAIRKILFPDYQLRLDRQEKEIAWLKQQLFDKEALLASIEPILIDLLERKISYSREEMAAALAPIMGDALRQQIDDAKEEIVDILYPIIGKTIRKSVAEAMKKLVDTVNQKIDKALRQNPLKKFLQSKITGVPESELVLKDAMPFQIEEVFVIHRESGLLLSHVSAKEPGVKVDEELISGMLTAIRDFVSEAFKSAEDQELDEIQYGQSKILLDRGHHSYLAVVISGIEPGQFDDDIHKLIRKIHNQYYKSLRHFDGDITQFSEMPKYLKRFIKKYEARPAAEQPQKSRPYLLYFAVGLVLIFLTIFAIKKFPGYLASIKGGQQIEQPIGTTGKLNARDVIAQIQQQMSQSADLKNLKPDFIVEDQQVIIEGKVPSVAIKRKLGYLVSEVDDVKVVINNLEIAGDHDVSFAEIREFLSQNMVCFDANTPTIPADEYAKLDSIFNAINLLDSIKLVIRGYSDSLADSAYNLRLSEQRAARVSDYFIAKGFPKNKIVIKAYGEKFAISSNETEQGRAKNRRVEFDIIRTR